MRVPIFYSHLPHNARTALRNLLPALVLAALVSLTVAACGVNGSTGQQSSVTHCGSISALGSSGAGASATPASAETCFSQAYAHCQPATLIYTQRGVDAGVTRTFAIHSSGGQCSISETVHLYSAVSRGTPPPDKTYTCGGLVNRSNTLVVSGCGPDQDISIPTVA